MHPVCMRTSTSRLLRHPSAVTPGGRTAGIHVTCCASLGAAVWSLGWTLCQCFGSGSGKDEVKPSPDSWLIFDLCWTVDWALQHTAPCPSSGLSSIPRKVPCPGTPVYLAEPELNWSKLSVPSFSTLFGCKPWSDVSARPAVGLNNSEL